MWKVKRVSVLTTQETNQDFMPPPTSMGYVTGWCGGRKGPRSPPGYCNRVHSGLLLRHDHSTKDFAQAAGSASWGGD